jgi:hypothetical protein
MKLLMPSSFYINQIASFHQIKHYLQNAYLKALNIAHILMIALVL